MYPSLSSFGKGLALYLKKKLKKKQNKTCNLLSQECFVPSLLKVGTVILENRSYKCCQRKYNYFYLTLKKGVTLHLLIKKFEFPPPKDLIDLVVLE